jgi:hypothetical protein
LPPYPPVLLPAGGIGCFLCGAGGGEGGEVVGVAVAVAGEEEVGAPRSGERAGGGAEGGKGNGGWRLG